MRSAVVIDTLLSRLRRLLCLLVVLITKSHIENLHLGIDEVVSPFRAFPLSAAVGPVEVQ